MPSAEETTGKLSGSSLIPKALPICQSKFCSAFSSGLRWHTALPARVPVFRSAPRIGSAPDSNLGVPSVSGAPSEMARPPTPLRHVTLRRATDIRRGCSCSVPRSR